MNGVQGDWRHPRNNLDVEAFTQLLTFMAVSQEDRFEGIRYTTSREFASELGVTPQRVRTLLMIMRNLGLIEDRYELPIILTESGKTLKTACEIIAMSTVSTNMKDMGYKLYGAVISAQLTLFNFDPNGRGYVANPIGSFNPLREMLQILNQEGPIAEERFVTEVGISNYTYWKEWLCVTRMISFDRASGTFLLSTDFLGLREAIIGVPPTTSFSETHWREIRANPFLEDHPFGNVIRETWGDVARDIIDSGQTLSSNIQEHLKAIIAESGQPLIYGETVTIEDLISEREETEGLEIEKLQGESLEERKSKLEERDIEVVEGRVAPPKKIYVEQYRTDQGLSARMKEESGFLCQSCMASTFETTGGYNYTETHHLIGVGKGGADAPMNIVVLCPLCHRKVHYGTDEVRVQVYEKLVLNGVVLNIEELLERGLISQSIYDTLK
jgi:hypothetical protein